MVGDHMQGVELGANDPRSTGAKSVGFNGLMGARTPGMELLLRLTVSVLTVISLSLIASDQGFSGVPAFNYLLASTVLSFLYCFFESMILSHQLTTSRQVLPISFHAYSTVTADLVCAILLLSGSSAAFGVTTYVNDAGRFFSQATGAASMALIAFVFLLLLLVLSSHRFSAF